MLSSLTLQILLVTSITTCTADALQRPLSTPATSTPATFIDRSIFRSRVEDFLESHVRDYGDIQDEIHAPFEGIATFAHLNLTDCFSPKADGKFDIAILGAPFDLGVTYRPGARFGPSGARMGSRRLSPAMAYSMDHLVNPFKDWASVVDCGDIANNPFDKLEAIQQLQQGWEKVSAPKMHNSGKGKVPRIIGIGGDHTISLPAIRALYKAWGPITVLHFDSHLDSWDPRQLGGKISKYGEVSHGTMFHILHEEGLLAEEGNMHIGARSMLFDKNYDLNNDARCGFSYIRARDMDSLGLDGIVNNIAGNVKDRLVYVSIDIDVLDPAFAPATGTIEPGGWTTRELLHILNGLSTAGVKILGADVVEFSPIYDNAAETTAIAVTQIIYELLQWMIKVPVQPQKKSSNVT